MAYVECKLKSMALMSTVSVKLYFPTDNPEEVGCDVKGVLTLLHGYTNSGDDWVQMSAAARYAADNGLVLIMPDCANSFYHDMVYGGAYKTFVTQEMPLQLNRIFRIPQEREKNYIAGLSMGGYGALYLAFSRPDLYAGCASFSGAVDLGLMLQAADTPETRAVAIPVFGNVDQLPPESDLHVLARRVAQLPKEQQPKILMTNGLQDLEPYFIVQQNESLHATLKTLGLAQYKRMQWNGVHEWNFWDRSLVYAIDYFLENGYAAKKLEDWKTPAIEG